MIESAPALAPVQQQLAAQGYARIPGGEVRARLSASAPGDADVDGWLTFADSWNRLGPDRYMADGGRYRRRRHAAFALERGALLRKPHQPHYQSRDYNILNGDVQRWFDPVEPTIADGPVMQAILALALDAFDPDRRGDWHMEMHQFRIEATPGESGRPTPEGMHRDGVDHVLVMLIERRNVQQGVTRIGLPDGTPVGEFTLTDPADTMLIDDRRIHHGVTEIHPVDPSRPAWRDALVLTLAAR